MFCIYIYLCNIMFYLLAYTCTYLCNLPWPNWLVFCQFLCEIFVFSLFLASRPIARAGLTDMPSMPGAPVAAIFFIPVTVTLFERLFPKIFNLFVSRFSWCRPILHSSFDRTLGISLLKSILNFKKSDVGCYFLCSEGTSWLLSKYSPRNRTVRPNKLINSSTYQVAFQPMSLFIKTC